MATSYRGMYRPVADGKPSHIQVASAGGHTIPLPIEEYESRGDLPVWHELPTEKQHRALSAVYSSARESLSFINPADTEACIHHGWLESVGRNRWQLTELGKQFL